ncbi:putative membrane protein [Deinococcus metalli]|uniref:Membrane protein n=1 Tax=Deinococcus metalli TaxID=1141878 RepID=A0A7W8NRH6_9DEIO|nr:DUF1304 domain-containing protein [Deinococcus metalli]MBB5377900.1 putative membrane protein [Deinococcus metalli]GHF55220.1 membrane protein [Deinococcus metalli]
MSVLAGVLVAGIALLHVYILVLEMVLWETPRAMRAFGTTPDFARQTRALAANQGLYNGFLAAGLLWGLLIQSPSVQLFFLSCVAVAGIYGALTANRRILFVQTVPAAVAILAVLLSR